ncbi:MAG: cadherin-like domain-containing protein [Burkholderiaceae bacterium]
MLDPASGALSFVAPPVFSAPTDANADNVHELVVAVTDAQGATSTLALTVRVTDLEFAPTLTIGQPLLLGSGGEVVLTDAELSATDADDALGTLRFVLDRLPQHGDLTRDGSALAIGDDFGMDEVMAGRIRYASSESIADSLALHVVDPGGARSASASLTITVVALQAPVVVTQPQAEAAASAAAAPAQAASDAPAAGQPAGETGAAIATLDDRATETDRKNTRGVDVVLVADLDLSASLPTAGEQGSVRAVVSASIQRSDTAAGFTPPSLIDTLRFAPAEAGGTGTPTSTLGAAEIRGTERFQAAVSSRAWQAELDRAREEATRETTLVGTLTGGSAAVVGSLSVGYVFWLLRGGMLLTSLLTTIPAWYALDPMPVLSRRGAELDDEAGDRVEGLFGDARRARSATPTAGSVQRAVPEVGTVDAAAQAQGAEDR